MSTATRSTSSALVAAFVSLLGAAGCHDASTTADFTSLQVLAYFDGDLPIDTLDVAGKLADGTDAFMPGKITITALTNPPARRHESAVLILGPELAGKTARVSVDGKMNGQLLVSGAKDVVFVLGQAVTASIALTSPAKCGDGAVDTGEACDDGNTAAGDGCAADCTVERGYVCTLAPSRCFDESETVFADAGATCPGDGSAATPFCKLGTAVTAPRTTTVIVRRGLYREQVALDHLRLEIVAEDGAVVEGSEAPAFHVSGGSIVTVTNLVVRGQSGTPGGGVVVEGAGTTATFARVSIGPSAATGLVLQDGASLVLRRSRVAGNGAGGVELDSTADYTLENDLITENGSDASAFGGIVVRRSSGRSRLVNLTVAANRAKAELLGADGGAGVRCDAEAEVVNSIVWQNAGGPPVSSAHCRTSYSDLGPFDVVPSNLGTSFSLAPDFLPDFHVTTTSPCKDRGDPTGIQPAGVAPAEDYDGDARPAGSAVDVGADEVG